MSGKTKGPLNIRMNGHRDDWRHKRFERSPVGEHFCSSGHDFMSCLSLLPVIQSRQTIPGKVVRATAYVV